MWQYLVFVGAAASLYGSWAYIRDTLAGKTQPNRVTWLLWGLLPLIAAFATLSKYSTLAVVPVLVAGLTPLLIFGASFVNPKAYWKIGALDWLCGGLSVCAVAFWLTSREPAVATAFSILADALAGVPTVIKAWKAPHSETPAVFAMGIFSAATSFFALKSLDFVEIGFPLYLLLIDTISLFGILWGRRNKTTEETIEAAH